MKYTTFTYDEIKQHIISYAKTFNNEPLSVSILLCTDHIALFLGTDILYYEASPATLYKTVTRLQITDTDFTSLRITFILL